MKLQKFLRGTAQSPLLFSPAEIFGMMSFFTSGIQGDPYPYIT
jgi:hypothetical protein